MRLAGVGQCLLVLRLRYLLLSRTDEALIFVTRGFIGSRPCTRFVHVRVACAHSPKASTTLSNGASHTEGPLRATSHLPEGEGLDRPIRMDNAVLAALITFLDWLLMR